MKTISTIFFIWLLANFANAQNKSLLLNKLPDFFVDDNVLPAYLKQIYKIDATRLAIRLLRKEQRLSKQTIRVPEELVHAIYNALIAVRVSDYGAIDTIATKYYVRTFNEPSVESIVLLAEHDANWLEPIRNGNDSTKNTALNNIIREYNLVITKLVYLDEERSGLVLQSREPLNIDALRYQLFMEEGIGSIAEMNPYGDGSDIDIQRTTTGWEVTYSVRFGNCLKKCQKSHNWKFIVADDGVVTYVGSEGHTIPPWVEPIRSCGKCYPNVLKK